MTKHPKYWGGFKFKNWKIFKIESIDLGFLLIQIAPASVSLAMIQLADLRPPVHITECCPADGHELTNWIITKLSGLFALNSHKSKLKSFWNSGKPPKLWNCLINRSNSSYHRIDQKGFSAFNDSIKLKEKAMTNFWIGNLRLASIKIGRRWMASQWLVWPVKFMRLSWDCLFLKRPFQLLQHE